MSALFISYPLALLVSTSLGPEGYGKYGFVTAVAPLIAVLLLFGSDQFVVRFISRRLRDTSIVYSIGRAVVSSVFTLVIVVSILILFLLAAFYLIDKTLEGDWSSSIELLIFTVVLVALISQRKLLSAVLRSFRIPEKAQFSESLVQPVFMCIFVCPLYYGFILLEPLTYVLLCLILSYSLSVLYSYYVLPVGTAPKLKFVRYKKLGVILTNALPFMGMTISNEVMTYADRVLVAALSGFSDAGVYLVAARNAALVTVAVGAVQFVIAPYIATLKREADLRKLQGVCSLHTGLINLLSILCAVFLVLCVDFLLSLFGDDFLLARDSILILLSGYCISFLFGAPVQYLYMIGHQRSALVVVVLFALINVLLNALLIPKYGINGASVATAFSFIGLRLVGAILLYLKEDIRSDVIYFILNVRNVINITGVK
jgi:O-antigen/teichoic acid export membrane protein